MSVYLKHNPKKLAGPELLAKMHKLVDSMRQDRAEFIAYLSEVSARKLHLNLGFSSLYEFCLETFRLSEGAVYRRIQVANVVTKFPFILDYLAAGSLSLTSASLLCPHLRGEKARQLIDSCRGLTRRETEMKIAEFVCKKEAYQERDRFFQEEKKTKPFDNEEPYRDGLVRYQFCGEQEFAQKLERVRQVVAGKSRGRDLESIFFYLMEFYLSSKDPKQQKCRERSHDPNRRQVPMKLRLCLLQEASYQCTYLGVAGRRCQEKRFLEVDHILPFSQGGLTEYDNLQVLCKAHNQHKARKDHGTAHMGQFTKK